MNNRVTHRNCENCIGGYFLNCPKGKCIVSVKNGSRVKLYHQSGTLFKGISGRRRCSNRQLSFGTGTPHFLSGQEKLDVSQHCKWRLSKLCLLYLIIDDIVLAYTSCAFSRALHVSGLSK